MNFQNTIEKLHCVKLRHSFAHKLKTFQLLETFTKFVLLKVFLLTFIFTYMYTQELLEMPGNEFNLKCIDMDTKRTFCNHEFFKTAQGYVCMYSSDGNLC